MKRNETNTTSLEDVLNNKKERLRLSWMMASLSNTKRSEINNVLPFNTTRMQISYNYN